MNTLNIIGSGGHTRSVLSTAKLMNIWQRYRILDIQYSNKEEYILGTEVESFKDYFNNENLKNNSFFISIGNNKKRNEIHSQLISNKCSFANIIHPKSYIDESSIIGQGNYIAQFANIGACAKIGDFNIVNSFANVEHEVKIGNFNHLAPSSIICGRSQLENNVFVGAGSIVIEKLFIANNNVIGAGAVVLKSIISSGDKYVGLPARKI